MSAESRPDSLFRQLGGEPVLRAVIDRFVDRVFDDAMIGFFFRNASRERIKAKEYEHAAEHLGGPVTYTGRPIEVAHAAHPIMGGHFMRRLQILREVLAEANAPSNVVEHWVRHTESLRPLVTEHRGSECVHPPLTARAKASAPTRDRALPLAGGTKPEEKS